MDCGSGAESVGKAGRHAHEADRDVADVSRGHMDADELRVRHALVNLRGDGSRGWGRAVLRRREGRGLVFFIFRHGGAV